MARKNTKATNGFRNKRMNEEVYQERRVVMLCIYRAKNLLKSNGIELPRIELRITEADRTKTTAIGRARLFDCVVWMPSDALVRYKKHVYQIVLHEILHAVWGIQHDNSCPLMSPKLRTDLSDEKAEQLFLKHIAGRIAEQEMLAVLNS